MSVTPRITNRIARVVSAPPRRESAIASYLRVPRCNTFGGGSDRHLSALAQFRPERHRRPRPSIACPSPSSGTALLITFPCPRGGRRAPKERGGRGASQKQVSDNGRTSPT